MCDLTLESCILDSEEGIGVELDWDRSKTHERTIARRSGMGRSSEEQGLVGDDFEMVLVNIESCTSRDANVEAITGCGHVSCFDQRRRGGERDDSPSVYHRVILRAASFQLNSGCSLRDCARHNARLRISCQRVEAIEHTWCRR